MKVYEYFCKKNKTSLQACLNSESPTTAVKNTRWINM